MSSKYIRNTDDATIVCKIPSDKNKVFVFKPKQIDKRSATVLSNGYTEISDVDLKILREESSTFQYYEKLGRLSIVDSLPHESMSTEQLIISLKNEIAALKRQLKDSSANPSAEMQEALQNAMTQIEEDQKALAAAAVKIEEQEKIIAALDEQLVAMAEEQADAPEDKKPDIADGAQ